jgi:hypothetical protein
MKKGGVKTNVLILMRKLNIISKKERILKPMRVTTVVGYDEDYNDLESQRHVFMLNKLSVRKGCQFNVETKNCSCGADIDEFLTKKYC